MPWRDDNPRPTAEDASRAEYKELNEHTAKGGKSTSHKDVGLGVPRSADAGATYPCAVRKALPSKGAQGTKTNLTIVIMKKVKIEFNYPETGEHGTTFSLTVDNMDVTSAKALERLPEMIERQYHEYLKLIYELPTSSRSLPDTR